MKTYIIFLTFTFLCLVGFTFAQNHTETASVVRSESYADNGQILYTYLFLSDGRKVRVPNEERTNLVLDQINERLRQYPRRLNVNFEVWENNGNRSLRLRSIPAVDPKLVAGGEHVMEVVTTWPLMMRPGASSVVPMGLYHVDNPGGLAFGDGQRVLVKILYYENGEYNATVVASRGAITSSVQDLPLICLESTRINYSRIRYDATPKDLPPHTIEVALDTMSARYAGIPARMYWTFADLRPGDQSYDEFFRILPRGVNVPLCPGASVYKKKTTGDGALFTYELSHQNGRNQLTLKEFRGGCTVLK